MALAAWPWPSCWPPRERPPGRRIRQIRLLTNNPTKRNALAGYGLEIVEQIPLIISPNENNRRYLETKKSKMGHLF